MKTAYFIDEVLNRAKGGTPVNEAIKVVSQQHKLNIDALKRAYYRAKANDQIKAHGLQIMTMSKKKV